MKPISCCYSILLLFVACAVNADTVSLYPVRDATLIEHPHGERANGAGPALFVGRTAQSNNAIRRALLYFDIASALPETAIIKSVALSLHLTTSNPVPVPVNIHRVLEDWQEGPASSSGGGGAISQAGDSTWLHTAYDTAYWQHVGGHFVARASATTVVAAADVYTWYDKQLLADVRLWQHAPQKNFGWLLKGDENTVQSVKRFDSRETSMAMYQPVLTIHYRLPGKKQHVCPDKEQHD